MNSVLLKIYSELLSNAEDVERQMGHSICAIRIGNNVEIELLTRGCVDVEVDPMFGNIVIGSMKDRSSPGRSCLNGRLSDYEPCKRLGCLGSGWEVDQVHPRCRDCSTTGKDNSSERND